jgi:thiamine pyrophosphate-dependent acetolactate synthase large subunit-like protein
MHFGNPYFVKLDKSMGLRGYRVELAPDLIPVLNDAVI